MKVHLVDGTYELFRACFGAPPASGRDGSEVGAVRGLIATLCALLRDPDVTHLACAFDTVIESFRNELFAGYKTGDGLDPHLLAQFPLAERAAAALGIVVWPMIEFEADDALATAAARLAGQRDVEQVVICSPDKDLMQCVVGNQVVVFDRRRRIRYDEPAVITKFGVPPRSIPDWLALVGDAADGLPGVPHWGARSASVILARFGAIDVIPDDPRDWQVSLRGADRLAASLREHRQEALLYRTLATLRRDVPIDTDLAGLRWCGARTVDLRALCDDIGAPGLVDRVPQPGA